jgi:hypothetical protein
MWAMCNHWVNIQGLWQCMTVLAQLGGGSLLTAWRQRQWGYKRRCSDNRADKREPWLGTDNLETPPSSDLRNNLSSCQDLKGNCGKDSKNPKGKKLLLMRRPHALWQGLSNIVSSPHPFQSREAAMTTSVGGDHTDESNSSHRGYTLNHTMGTLIPPRGYTSYHPVGTLRITPWGHSYLTLLFYRQHAP